MCFRASGVRGFSMISAIFLIVVLALLGAAMAKFSIMQHTTSTQDYQGVRAYLAAQSGVEWGLYRVLDPDAAPSLPACWSGSASVTLGGDLAGFSTGVSCTQTASTDEDGNSVAVYSIVATASIGSAGTQNYVERQVQTTITRCLTGAGSAC